jgi:hypothetical protein
MVEERIYNVTSARELIRRHAWRQHTYPMELRSQGHHLTSQTHQRPQVLGHLASHPRTYPDGIEYSLRRRGDLPLKLNDSLIQVKVSEIGLTRLRPRRAECTICALGAAFFFLTWFVASCIAYRYTYQI